MQTVALSNVRAITAARLARFAMPIPFPRSVMFDLVICCVQIGRTQLLLSNRTRVRRSPLPGRGAMTRVDRGAPDRASSLPLRWAAFGDWRVKAIVPVVVTSDQNR